MAWMNRLRADGYLVCPGSCAVPVDVRGVRGDGVGLHFRCRGTAIRLAAYRPGRAAWQVAVRDASWCPEESLQLWVHSPLDGTPPPTDARLAFPGDAGPDREVILDGSDAWGWRGHEAGLLRPDTAARLFDHLLATLADPTATAAVLQATAPPSAGQAARPTTRHETPEEITIPAARTGRSGQPALATSPVMSARPVSASSAGGGRHMPPVIL